MLKLFICTVEQEGIGEEETLLEDVLVSLSRGDSMSSCLHCQSVSASITAAKHSWD